MRHARRRVRSLLHSAPVPAVRVVVFTDVIQGALPVVCPHAKVIVTPHVAVIARIHQVNKDIHNENNQSISFNDGCSSDGMF